MDGSVIGALNFRSLIETAAHVAAAVSTFVLDRLLVRKGDDIASNRYIYRST